MYSIYLISCCQFTLLILQRPTSSSVNLFHYDALTSKFAPRIIPIELNTFEMLSRNPACATA